MLSESQIKNIAKEIIYDIQKYIEEHQIQYQLFLKNEKSNESEDINSELQKQIPQ